MRRLGYTYATIAHVFGCTRATASKSCNVGPRVGKRASPQTVTQRLAIVKTLVPQVEQVNGRLRPRFASAACVASELNKHDIHVSAKTVVRDIKRIGGKRRVRPFATTLDKDEEAARLKFAKKSLRQSPAYTARIVFSDESWITTNDHSGRFQWVLEGEAVLPREMKSKWNVAATQIWAAVGVGCRSSLVVFPKCMLDEEGNPKAYRLNAARYVQRCLSPVHKDLMKNGRIFQFDGARCHVAKRSVEYLTKKDVKYIPDWPPYSPDLNMIEGLWGVLKKRIAQRVPRGYDELVRVAKEEWNRIPESTIDAYVLGFRGKCSALVRDVQKRTKMTNQAPQVGHL
jgi:hypothetical protein